MYYGNNKGRKIMQEVVSYKTEKWGKIERAIAKSDK